MRLYDIPNEDVDLGLEEYIKYMCGSLPPRYRYAELMVTKARQSVGQNIKNNVTDHFYFGLSGKDFIHIECRCGGSIDDKYSNYNYYGQKEWEEKNKDIILHAFNNSFDESFREIYIYPEPNDFYYDLVIADDKWNVIYKKEDK